MEDIIDDIECSEEDDEKMVIDIPNKDAIPPSIAEVLGELQDESNDQEQILAIKSQYTQMDLRKEEDLISNPHSVIDHEIILREEEDKKNQGKIEVPLSANSPPTDYRSIVKDMIGKGLNYSQNQKEIIAAKRQHSSKEQDIIASQDDLLEFIDSRPEDQRKVSPLKKEIKEETPSKNTPAKKDSASKQSNLFNYMKKRDEKQATKIGTQSPVKMVDTADKFKKYESWFQEHTVTKNAKPEAEHTPKLPNAKKETISETPNGKDKPATKKTALKGKKAK